MRVRKVITASLVLPVVCAACASSRMQQSSVIDPAAVAVRFVGHTVPIGFSPTEFNESRPTMGMGIEGNDGPLMTGETAFDENCLPGFSTAEVSPYHVVLWGGQFAGRDVTYAAPQLTTGQYMFGLLDQEDGNAYQGWISVNNGGDDLLNVLNEWQQTVNEQKEWLGFENKIRGKFTSTTEEDFKAFAKQLRTLERLERRLGKAISKEHKARTLELQERNEFLASAEILLMPGQNDFFQPTTQPAFRGAELASVRAGTPMTKVLLTADYRKAVEKLNRVNSLRSDLSRCKVVLSEEARRLENRGRFYRMTDHLYGNGDKMVTNERRLQKTLGSMERIDQQLTEHRKRSAALTFVAGLFSPQEALAAFQKQEQELGREQIVLEEKKQQISMRFDATAGESYRRIGLERERQSVVASLESIKDQFAQLGEARDAMAKLQDDTGVIHRHGPSRMIAATLVDQDIPNYLVDAIERESFMTVRLQKVESIYAPSVTNASNVNQFNDDAVSWNK